MQQSHFLVLKKSIFLCGLALFSSLAVVNSLSTDDGPLRWVPVIESLIPITIHRKKVHVIRCRYVQDFTHREMPTNLIFFKHQKVSFHHFW